MGLATVAFVPLAGSTTKPLQYVNADGSGCHRIGRSYPPKLTCTPTAVPTDVAEAEAKSFDADATSLTVYVLRHRWGDASVLVPVTVDGEVSASTIPDSLVSLRLKPGSHRVSAPWDGQTVEISVVDLIGSGWSWGNRFKWEPAQVEAVKARAHSSKLVADLDLRRQS